MDLHNDFINKYGSYNLLYNLIDRKTDTNDDKKTDNNVKFIFSVGADNNIIIRGTYVVIGSYSMIHNVWIWANMSLSLDKRMIDKIIDIKEHILSNATKNATKTINFMNANHIVLPQLELHEHINYIGNIINKDILIDNANPDIARFIVVDDIFYDDRS